MTKVTKRARDWFRRNYSRNAFNVIDYARRGWSSKRIAEKLRISPTSVAAYRANLSRGAYGPYASVSKSGQVYGSMF